MAAEAAGAFKLMFVTPTTAIIFRCLLYVRNYDIYSFSKDRMANCEAKIKKIEGATNLDPQKKEECIKDWQDSREFWASEAESYSQYGGAKIYDFYDKIMKKKK